MAKRRGFQEKNYEKLEKIRNQESDRQKFIAKIKRFVSLTFFFK